MVAIEDIVSSRARLTIASLLSVRPRTLGELAETTGISVQAVLKHLGKLSEAGMLREESVAASRHLRARKLYSVERRKVLDYSEGDMVVAALSALPPPSGVSPREPYRELESLAEDVMLLRRRVRETAKRMKRMAEEVLEDELRIEATLGSLGLAPYQRQIAYLMFSEDSLGEVKRVLRKHYGCEDGDAAVREVEEALGRRR